LVNIGNCFSVFILAFCFGWLFILTMKSFPGLYLGKIPIGGMQAEELRSLLKE
jgi:hypothetical protein